MGDKGGKVVRRNNVAVLLKTWDQIIDESRARLHFCLEKLEYQANKGAALSHLREHYARHLVGVLDESPASAEADAAARMDDAQQDAEPAKQSLARAKFKLLAVRRHSFRTSSVRFRTIRISCLDERYGRELSGLTAETAERRLWPRRSRSTKDWSSALEVRRCVNDERLAAVAAGGRLRWLPSSQRLGRLA